MEELNLIRKVVWSYVKTSPVLDFDDLFSEACLAYLEAEPKYDASKGKKSTFVHHVVSNRLNSLISKEGKKNTKEHPAETFELEYLGATECEPTPEQFIIAKERWEELLEQLSPEALVVWGVIEKKDIYLCTDKPRQCRGVIVKILREAGWSWNKIWNTFNEIKNAVSA